MEYKSWGHRKGFVRFFTFRQGFEGAQNDVGLRREVFAEDDESAFHVTNLATQNSFEFHQFGRWMVKIKILFSHQPNALLSFLFLNAKRNQTGGVWARFVGFYWGGLSSNLLKQNVHR